MALWDHFAVFRGKTGAWFAVPPAFCSLLHHPIGRAYAKRDAVKDLLGHPEFVHRAKLGEWPLNPSFDEFVEVVPDANFFEELGIPLACMREPLDRSALRVVWSCDPA